VATPAQSLIQVCESVAWFPGADAQSAIQADDVVRKLAHGLLAELTQSFPNLDQDGLLMIVGKAEKVLASGLSDLINPDPIGIGDEDDDEEDDDDLEIEGDPDFEDDEDEEDEEEDNDEEDGEDWS
jgi:hypothetical protein